MTDAALARFIATATDPALYLMDRDGRVTAWNPGAEFLTGWRASEMIGVARDALLPDEEKGLGSGAPDLVRAGAEGKSRRETWRRRSNGTEFFADVTVTPIRDALGGVVGFGEVMHDITDRRASEIAVERSELHLRSILATVPDAMIVIDSKGRIMLFSVAAEALFGWRESEVIGKNVSMLMPENDSRNHDSYLERYLTTGERRIIGIGRIVVGRRRDGTDFPMELSVGEARSEGHRIFTGFIRDLSEQQRAEFKMKELQSELIHVSRVSAMGTMASTLAHELNQPLTAIANYLQAGETLLERRGEDESSPLREAVREAADEALRAGQIVRRLRDFVSKGDVDRHVEDLPDLIDNASRLALTGARERGVRAFFHFDRMSRNVVADRIQIQQVIVNLVRNAIDAMTQATDRNLTISTLPPEDGMIEVTIADTGSGISDMIGDKLFEAFSSSKEGGMGLGLSICRTIVEAHGGRIWANSAVGDGTVFHFTLPSAELDDR